MKKDKPIQIRVSGEDLKIAVRLMKKYGSSRSEIFRRGLRCLDARERPARKD